MDALTLDQIRVFLSVVDEGSFPKAAKSLQRAQSAVTYAIRKLEAEIGVPLFDRSAYRSVLTPAGRALLTRARRIAEEAGAFREQARGLAGGAVRRPSATGARRRLYGSANGDVYSLCLSGAGRHSSIVDSDACCPSALATTENWKPPGSHARTDRGESRDRGF